MDSLASVPTWQIFVAIGLVLSILEVFAAGFVLLPLGLGFLLAAPFTGLVDSFVQQIMVLVVSEIIVLILFNRFVKPKLYSKPTSTNVDSMIGKEVKVTKAISSDSWGAVKLYGDEWTATLQGGDSIDAGSTAVIVKMDGNKAVVKAKK